MIQLVAMWYILFVSVKSFYEERRRRMSEWKG
jgi:hypothetical protein